ncbi:MAG: L,D-transpeptidase family protein [Mogibacterium sp.]|nr:L,D-transpeptidase family protein [Mogibacterium sp.]
MKTRNKLTIELMILLTAVAMCLLLTSCKPYLPVNPKYSYSSFTLELGDPISPDIGEYVDLSEMSSEDEAFVRDNTELLLDDVNINDIGMVKPGDHKLTIRYCGRQYRQYSFTVFDRVPPEFTKAKGLYTFEGLPLDEKLVDKMFAAEDNSGDVEITLDKPKIDFYKAGKYVVKATAKDSSGNTATAEATVNVQKPEYGAVGTYVFVSIAKQHLTYFVDSKPVMDCPVVTGNVHGHSTPKGTFRLNYKARNIILKGSEDNGDPYESFVNYWMAFIGSSYGLHDTSWRNTFGGDIYINGGSHGCVNMPKASAAKLYGMIEPGTPVLVY